MNTIKLINDVKAHLEPVKRSSVISIMIEKSFTFFLLHVKHAYSTVGRGTLVLRHSVPHFSLHFLRYCLLGGGAQRLACLVTRAQKLKIKKKKQ